MFGIPLKWWFHYHYRRSKCWEKCGTCSGSLDRIIPDNREFVLRTPLFGIAYLYKRPVADKASLHTGWRLFWIPNPKRKYDSKVHPYKYRWDNLKPVVSPQDIQVLWNAYLQKQA